MRPEYSEEAAELGRKAEIRFMEWLVLIGKEFRWNNQAGQTPMIDFFVKSDKDGKVKGVEVERKDPNYLDLATKHGIDYLAHKVDKYDENDYYVMDFGDRFHIITMGMIKRYGKKIKKDTTRLKKDEEFYRLNMTLTTMFKYPDLTEKSSG